MKSTVKSSFYFSAYPLKVIKNESPDKGPTSPYLKALLSGKSKTSNQPGEARVFRLTNTYNNQVRPVRAEEADKLPKDIELTEKEWFNNYE